MKVSIMHVGELDLACTSTDPYYILGCKNSPELHKEDFITQSGETLSPGDRITYIGSNKTSTGFDILSTKEYTSFRYDGMIESENGALVVWTPVKNGVAQELRHRDYVCMYYAHFVEEMNGRCILIYTNMAGAARIIETEIFKRCEEGETTPLLQEKNQK